MNEIFGRFKKISSPNCIEADDANLTNTQDIADVFDSIFQLLPKICLHKTSPSQSSLIV